jgi:hypothetical protein
MFWINLLLEKAVVGSSAYDKVNGPAGKLPKS